ncbi:MAG TPA: hypothetical protein VF787_25145 [Thermoanaerobaculia bacterium]
MPEAWTIKRHVPLAQRLRAILALGRLIEPLQMPRGVRKFRSIEEANEERERYERARLERIRARNEARKQ